MVKFDRKVFFDSVRASLFGGALTQQQVDGMNYKLDQWEDHPYSSDLRHLAYALATSKHETASSMWPISEYGEGSGQSYGETDPETGQAYYGRGDVQLTWRDNYRNAASKLALTGDDDLEWHAERALDPKISADVMFKGMTEGWFRPPHNLAKYFNDTANDAYGAREIINGDKKTVPSWSHGVSIGKLVADYHAAFLDALEAAAYEPAPPPQPGFGTAHINIQTSPGVSVSIALNGEIITHAVGE